MHAEHHTGPYASLPFQHTPHRPSLIVIVFVYLDAECMDAAGDETPYKERLDIIDILTGYHEQIALPHT